MADQVSPLPPVPSVVPLDPPVPHAMPFTVRDTMVLCGTDDVTQFDGKTAAQHFTEDVFDRVLTLVWIKSLQILKRTLSLTLQ